MDEQEAITSALGEVRYCARRTRAAAEDVARSTPGHAEESEAAVRAWEAATRASCAELDAVLAVWRGTNGR